MPKVSVTLTDKSIRNALRTFKQSTSRKKKLSDGGCKGLKLIFLKTKSGTSARWEIHRLGLERSLYGLTFSDCGIEEARIKAREYFASLRDGIDPLLEKKRIKQEQDEQAQEATKQAYTFGRRLTIGLRWCERLTSGSMTLAVKRRQRLICGVISYR